MKPATARLPSAPTPQKRILWKEWLGEGERQYQREPEFGEGCLGAVGGVVADEGNRFYHCSVVYRMGSP